MASSDHASIRNCTAVGPALYRSARRGQISIRKVDRLRSLACECNAAVSHHFNDVLKGVYPAEH
ncbi:hypothetical protein MES5069_180003 [Mesorhizobium escarrei]|uniref:Transposase n=1 Tax=Mesorhizobium escarrei TaxID=666018 RepID=A0ABM9DLW8_9HYPH|nr:hypothetical protein MES5069_180003 [Mesorhizobium escarrei]